MALWGRGAIQQRQLAADGQVWVVLSPLGIYLYSTYTLDLIAQIEDVQFHQISPDGQSLAVADSAHQINLYRLVDGQKLLSLPSPMATGSTITGLRFSADGARLAVGYIQPVILIWDLETGQVEFRLQHAIMPAANWIEFSPDGKYLANNTSSGILGLWSLAEERLVWRTANGGRLTAASFLPDGRRLLTNGPIADQILIWDLNSGSLNQTIQATNLVEYLNFSQDGGSLFFLTRRPQSGQYLIEQRSLRDGKLETFAEFPDNYAIAPDRLSLAGMTKDGRLEHFNLRSWELTSDPAINSDPSVHLVFSFSGNALAAVSRQAFSLWSYPQMLPLEEVAFEQPLFNLHLSSLLGLQLVEEDRLLAYGLDKGELFVWDVFAGAIQRFDLPPNDSYSPALAQNGSYLAVCTPEGLRLFNLATSETSLLDRCKSPGQLVFSKDSTRLAQASGLQIDLLSLPAGTRSQYLAGNTLEILSMAFSPDGSFFASGTSPQRGGAESVVWDFARPLFPMRLPVPSFGVESIAFSGDNQYLATGGGDDRIRLWRVVDGWLLRVRALEGSASSLTFSPDSQIVVVGLSSGDLQLLSIPDAEQLAVLEGHTGRITGLVFSNDGTALYSASADGTVRLWGIPPAPSNE
jgi:WD40 repeat protein